MSDSEFHAVVDALMRRPAGHPPAAAPPAQTVAVLGAGPVGQLLACAALAATAEVRLCSVYGAELDALRDAGGITVRGADLVGSYPVADATSRAQAIRIVPGVDDAVAGADVVIIATPAAAQQTYCGILAPRLADGQAVTLVPGRFLGAAAFATGLRQQLCQADIAVAELAEVPYLVRGTPGALTVHGKAGPVGCAALPAVATERVTQSLRDFLPMLRPDDSVLRTSFAGTTALLAAVPALLATALLEEATGPVLLRDILTPGIARSVVRRIDEERRGVAFRYGVRDLPAVHEQVAAVFGGEGDDLSAVVRSADAFADLPVRSDIAAEVGYSLVPLSGAAAALGMSTPATDGAVNLASAMLGTDLARTGRSLEGLGLGGYRPDELREVLARSGLEPAGSRQVI